MWCSRYASGAVFLGLLGVSLIVYQLYGSEQNYTMTQDTGKDIDNKMTNHDRTDNAKESRSVQTDTNSIRLSQENWVQPASTQNDIRELDQSDNQLTEYIAQHWLLHPSMLPLNLAEPQREHYSQMKQSATVDEILGRKRNGFFIECGAANGEMLSNSLFFEKSRNWTGVLVEPDVEYFSQLVKKHRHSYLVQACLSPTKNAVMIPFRKGGLIGALANYMSPQHAKRMDHELGKSNETVLVQCFPIYSILKAIGVTHVDFFSLDIEGAEPDVLRTLPLDKITVDVFCIEHNGEASKLNEIKNILVGQHGYEITHVDQQDIYLKRKQL
jgi:FkbM family methyltransferase